MIKIKSLQASEFPFLVYGMKVSTGLYSKEAAEALEKIFELSLRNNRSVFFEKWHDQSNSKEKFDLRHFVTYNVEVVTTGHLARKYDVFTNFSKDDEKGINIKRVLRDPDGEIVFYSDWCGAGYWNILKYMRLLTAECFLENQHSNYSKTIEKWCSLFSEYLGDIEFSGYNDFTDSDLKWMSKAFDFDFERFEKIDYHDIIGIPCNPFLTAKRKDITTEFEEATKSLHQIEDSLTAVIRDDDAWKAKFKKLKGPAKELILKIEDLYKQIISI